MNKLLTGVCASALFLNAAHANCDATSFTGAFVGAGFVMSFDKDEYEMDFGFSASIKGEDGAESRDAEPSAAKAKERREKDGEVTYPRQKKNKTAFGGQIVLGYGHQFENNVYVAIMHESLFASKARVNHLLNLEGEMNNFSVNQSRRVWSPSVGVALGYVVGQWNFGLRSGFYFEKVKFHHENISEDTEDGRIESASVTAPNQVLEKKITMNSPYVGAYVEYKLNSVVMYANVDYCFGKKKTFEHVWSVDEEVFKEKHDDGKEGTYGNAETQHKRSSWKVALGVKANINNLVSMAS